MTRTLNLAGTHPRGTTDAAEESTAAAVAQALLEQGFTSFIAVPCGVLAPLLGELDQRDRATGGPGVAYVPREDTALGVAVGQRLAGGRPLVLMQNSGLGQSLNALASLVLPYEIGVPMIISVRGAAPDHTAENTAMGVLTEPALRELGIPTRILARPEPDGPAGERELPGPRTESAGHQPWPASGGDGHPGAAAARWLREAARNTAAAVLVRPDYFGWEASA